jgi:hypothetical protein
MCVKQNTGGFLLHLFEYALPCCTMNFVWSNARSNMDSFTNDYLFVVRITSENIPNRKSDC